MKARKSMNVHRRWGALALVLALLLGLCAGIGVSAEEPPTGSITVTNDPATTGVSISGKEYKAYRVLDLVQNADKDAFAYTLNENFKGLFTQAAHQGGASYAPENKSTWGYWEFFMNDQKDQALFAEGNYATQSGSAESSDTVLKTSVIYEFLANLTAAELEDFAEMVQVYAQRNDVAATAAATGEVLGDKTEQAAFTALPLGYYLIFGENAVAVESQDATPDTVTAACILDTTTYNTETATYAVSIPLKAYAPPADKVIVQGEGDAETTAKADAVSIGDTVTFRVTSAVPNLTGYTAYTFEMHDTLSRGLTFNADSMTVTVGTTLLTEVVTGGGSQPAGDYTLTAAPVTDSGSQPTGETAVTVALADLCTLARNADGEQTIPAGTPVIFEYTATLNADAVVGVAGNPNTARITYSNDPYGTATNDTEDSVVKVYTFALDVYKYAEKAVETAAGTSETAAAAETTETAAPVTQKIALAGATFTVKPGERGNSTPISFVEVKGADNVVTGYRVATAEEIADTATVTVTSVVSGADGEINIDGLGAGTYVLTETAAPAGYNLLEESLTVTFAPEYQNENDATALTGLTVAEGAAYTQIKDDTGSITLEGLYMEVENSTGREVPSTGGRGTTVLYLVGGLLLLTAAALLGLKWHTARAAQRG